jgi:hypothetical protein
MATSRVLLMWAADGDPVAPRPGGSDYRASDDTAVLGQSGRGSGAPGPRRVYPDCRLADPAVELGRALYGVNCAVCHAEHPGGDSGPRLLRTSIVLDDQHGELMAPVIQNGRAICGMPKFALTTDQNADRAAFIQSFKAAGLRSSHVHTT